MRHMTILTDFSNLQKVHTHVANCTNNYYTFSGNVWKEESRELVYGIDWSGPTDEDGWDGEVQRVIVPEITRILNASQMSFLQTVVDPLVRCDDCMHAPTVALKLRDHLLQDNFCWPTCGCVSTGVSTNCQSQLQHNNYCSIIQPHSYELSIKLASNKENNQLHPVHIRHHKMQNAVFLQLNRVHHLGHALRRQYSGTSEQRLHAPSCNIIRLPTGLLLSLSVSTGSPAVSTFAQSCSVSPGCFLKSPCSEVSLQCMIWNWGKSRLGRQQETLSNSGRQQLRL